MVKVMRGGAKTMVLGAVVALGLAGGAFLLWGEKEPATSGGEVAFKRLSEDQYARSIESAFGEGIDIPGRFDPPRREAGLMAIGNGRVVVSRSGFEQAELRGRKIAAQLMSEKHRNDFITCELSEGQHFNEACARSFFERYGKLLYRRALTADELSSVVAVAQAAAEVKADFYQGMERGLSRLLVSPNFLFVSESINPESISDGVASLDDYSLATRISFLLWDAPPDQQLLDAVEAGELRSKSGIQKQVDRLIASPKFEQGVRAFFIDMFGYEQFQGLTKEQAIFPMYSSQLAEDAKEQTLRTIIDLLVTNEGDYRDLFTSKKTFLNRRLSALYSVAAPEAAVEDWAPYEFSDDDPRAGIFTQAAFLMLDPTHEGRTSPTIRGKAIREFYLCQHVPPPPPAVDFKLVQDTQNAMHKTARERLRVHAEVPTCAGCHAITDPIGLAMENYDAIGSYRTLENGAHIDASGTFEGFAYNNALELQTLLRESPAVTDCLTSRAYEYGVGRPINSGEREWLSYLREKFAEGSYKLAPLMKDIAMSNAFRTVSVSARSEAPLELSQEG